MVKTRQKRSQGTIERLSCQLTTWLLKAAGVKYAAYIINEIMLHELKKKIEGQK